MSVVLPCQGAFAPLPVFPRGIWKGVCEMGENTKIQWCHHSFNPWIGCTKVSEGCAHCYAEAQDKFRRWTPAGWGAGKPRHPIREETWKNPLRWNEWYTAAVERPRVFCASLADWLDDEVPVDWLARLLVLIHDTPNLDWLLLTKRPENWTERIQAARNFLTPTKWETAQWLNEWLPYESPNVDGLTREGKAPRNVWVGTTVENQARAIERVPLLQEIPAAVRFLSVEPMLERILLPIFEVTGGMRTDPESGKKQLELKVEKGHGIDWVICGGESGPGARPMEVRWAQLLREQCRVAGAAFFMKQLGGVTKKRGEMEDFPAELQVRELPQAKEVVR